MKFEIVTLFPDYFEVALRQSLLGKAIEKGLFELGIIDLRPFATDKHRTVDDTPFGGGGGMVMKIEPLDRCLQSLGYAHKEKNTRTDKKEQIVLTSAAGRKFTQDKAVEYSLTDRLTIICGHYLGIDDRLSEFYEIDEISIGDYVLTGGEPAAAVMVDAVARLIPKVLGNFESATNDSYMNQILGTPCYTRPSDYLGHEVPQALLTGNHRDIAQFRRLQAIRKCLENRPELLDEHELTEEELEFVEQNRKKDN